MMKITTKSGFDCEINANAFNDFRVMHLMADAEKDPEKSILPLIEMIDRVMGEEQEEALICFLEAQSSNGIATVDAVYAEFQSIMQVLTEAKKNTSL